MPWTPLIPFKGVEQIVLNLIAVIERDQAAALSWVNGGTALPSFAHIAKARRHDLDYPFLAVYGRRSVLRMLDEGRAIDESHEIWLELALLGSDPEALNGVTNKYMRAVHQMLVTAASSDIASGLSNPSDPEWDVTQMEYRWEVLEQDNQQYLQAGRMLFQVRVVES